MSGSLEDGVAEVALVHQVEPREPIRQIKVEFGEYDIRIQVEFGEWI